MRVYMLIGRGWNYVYNQKTEKHSIFGHLWSSWKWMTKKKKAISHFLYKWMKWFLFKKVCISFFLCIKIHQNFFLFIHSFLRMNELLSLVCLWKKTYRVHISLPMVNAQQELVPVQQICLISYDQQHVVLAIPNLLVDQTNDF